MTDQERALKFVNEEPYLTLDERVAELCIAFAALREECAEQCVTYAKAFRDPKVQRYNSFAVIRAETAESRAAAIREGEKG